MCELKIVSTKRELLQSLIVRGIVFVEEQQVPFNLECDDYDQLGRDDVLHILALEKQEPIAAGRIIFKSSHCVKLERIAVRQAMRSKGIGKRMVEFMLHQSKKNSVEKITMHAQRYLQPFYENLGFQTQGEAFYEAHIEHIFMQYKD